MKGFFTGLLAFVLVVVCCAAVYIFAFNKTIPTNWVAGQIETIKASKFAEEDQKPKKLKYSYEEVKYTKDGDKTVTTYKDKTYREYTDTSKDGAESYEIKCVDYNDKGEVSEEYTVKYYMEGENHIREEKGEKTTVEDFSEVGLFFLLAYSFYEDDGTLKTEIKTMIDENLEKVTQKGLNITLNLVKDNQSYTVTYNALSKKIVKMNSSLKTYTENVLTSEVNETIAF